MTCVFLLIFGVLICILQTWKEKLTLPGVSGLEVMPN